MNFESARTWSPADYCIAASTQETHRRLPELAAMVYDRVCRMDFAAPGFCLVDLGANKSSPALRGLMIELKQQLQAVHQNRAGCELAYFSAGRFDQQLTTKLHRDGGPQECLLMLGYEPSPVAAEIAIADYSKCAYDMGLAPNQFLELHNPMFAAGGDALKAYTTRVECFSKANFQILLINNSMAPFQSLTGGWQGVLHTATIVNPSDDHCRVVNSTMIVSALLGTPDFLSATALEEFRTATAVRRRGYDKPALEDDV